MSTYLSACVRLPCPHTSTDPPPSPLPRTLDCSSSVALFWLLLVLSHRPCLSYVTL
ncbi:uncharacterized protein LY79DRAFT_534507, partial [Colletotrichum navitas]